MEPLIHQTYRYQAGSLPTGGLLTLAAFLLLLVGACSPTQPSDAQKPEEQRGPGSQYGFDLDVGLERGSTESGSLTGEFGQTFRCTSAGLYKVEFLVATYRARIPSGTLQAGLRLATAPGPDLAQMSIPLKTIVDNTYVALQFPPIQNSADQSYYLHLTVQDIPKGYSFTVWHTNRDLYPGGQFFLNGVVQPSDMIFRTSTKK